MHHGKEAFFPQLDHDSMHISMFYVINGAIIDVIVQLNPLDLIDLIEHLPDLILLLAGKHGHGLRVLQGEYAGRYHGEDNDGDYLLEVCIALFILIMEIEVSIAHGGGSGRDIVDGGNVDIHLGTLEGLISQDIYPSTLGHAKHDPDAGQDMEDDAEVEERLCKFQNIIELFLLVGEIDSEVLAGEGDHLGDPADVHEPDELGVVAAWVGLDGYDAGEHGEQVDGQVDEEGPGEDVVFEDVREG